MKHSTPLFMTRRRFMELLQIKSKDTFRKRLHEDPAFPRPLGRLFRVRDVEAYLGVDALPTVQEERCDVLDLL